VLVAVHGFFAAAGAEVLVGELLEMVLVILELLAGEAGGTALVSAGTSG
jgi:hypothetical protein